MRLDECYVELDEVATTAEWCGSKERPLNVQAF
jgi:hypothetical protein